MALAIGTDMTLARRVCLVVVLLASACGGSSAPPTDATTDGGRGGGALCVARGLCMTPTYTPPELFGDYCFNGCQWCQCTADGEIAGCTANACDAGGAPDTGP